MDFKTLIDVSSAYPPWAKAVIGLCLAIIVAVLLFAKTRPEKGAPSSSAAGTVQTSTTHGSNAPAVSVSGHQNTVNTTSGNNSPVINVTVIQQSFQKLKAHNPDIGDDLSQKYPIGYVVLGYRQGTVVKLPSEHPPMQVQANWETSQISIDPLKHTVAVEIYNFSFTANNFHLNEGGGGTIHSSFPLERGRPFRSPFRVEGQVNMWFEVLDDNLDSFVFVVGFKR